MPGSARQAMTIIAAHISTQNTAAGRSDFRTGLAHSAAAMNTAVSSHLAIIDSIMRARISSWRTSILHIVDTA